MYNPKEQVAAIIASARSDLARALDELEKLPSFDSGAVNYAAHALNNYLTVIDGNIQLLVRALAGHPDPQTQGCLDNIQHASRLMIQTVGHMMNASTTLHMLMGRIDLVKLVQRGCDYYQRVAERKQIRILFEAALESPYVWTDTAAVAAVLDNLLSNAVKFSQPGKTIHASVKGEGAFLLCSIRDEGPGLSPEDQGKLFQRGVKLPPAPTAEEPSTGYGLAVAKELIEKLDGKIWCESNTGQGACFSFTLPAYEAQQQFHGPHRSQAEQGRPKPST